MKSDYLGNLTTLHYGKGLKNYQDTQENEGAYKVFGTNGAIGWTGDFLFEGPSIIVGRKGAYREIHWASDSSWVIDTAYYLTVKNEDIDLNWLYHKLKTIDLNRLDSGAAIPSTKREDFYAIKIDFPSKVTQLKIAQLLNKYNDLIENNRRRVQLLEDSARLLYREWFVHLRFPGHEHVKIVEGVPAGWSRKSIKECCKKISYGYTASAADENIGPKFLRITDIVPNTIDWDSVPYCPINDEDKKKYLLEEGDIVVARTGATVGYAKRMAKLDFDVVYASYLVKFKPDKQIIDDLILGTFMQSDEYKNFVRSNAGGAAQPNANAQVLAAAHLLIPTDNIQKLFREYTHRLILQKQNLEKQISGLIKARDLLLPRLMSGKISV